MSNNKPIAEWKTGESVEGFFILKEAFTKTATNGKAYLSCKFADKSGVISGTMWDYTEPIGPSDTGKIVKIRGSVSEYKGTPQVTIEKIRLKKDDDAVEIESLVPSAPLASDVMINTVMSLLSTIQDPQIGKLCIEIVTAHQSNWAIAPAAKGVHHAHLHGLLMHTMNMMRAADSLAAIYGDTVNRDLLLAGAFLHDIGKLSEYKFDEQTGLITGFTVRGQLIGHLVLGAEEVRDTAKRIGMDEEKSLLLEHMVLSHHGNPEWGAAVKPACVEAELLSLIDLADARGEIFREEYEKTEVGTLSEKCYALDGRRVFNHGLGKQ